VHTRRGQYDEALQAFNRATTLDEHYDWGWEGMAELLLARGEPEKALQMVERALAIRSHFVDRQHLKARILRALGRDDEAATVEQQAERFVAEQLALIEGAAPQATADGPTKPAK
jgi:tetratricopeptide (TPR) repeat protein